VDSFNWVKETGSRELQTIAQTEDSLIVSSTHSFGSQLPEAQMRSKRDTTVVELFIDLLATRELTVVLSRD